MSSPSPTLSRRRLLGLSGASAAVLALGVNAPAAAHAEPLPQRDGLFGLGVASGYPRPDGAEEVDRLRHLRPRRRDGEGEHVDAHELVDRLDELGDGAVTHPAVGVNLFGQAQDRLGRTHRGGVTATMGVDHQEVDCVAAHVEDS